MKLSTSLFWAKTTDDKNNPERQNAFHPLICHLIDVGIVTRKIWDDVLPTATKEQVVRSFGGNYLDRNELNSFASLIGFIAGLHDLGKCSPPFTLRYTKQEIRKIYIAEFSYEKYKEAYGEVKPAEAPHGYVTAIELPKILTDENFNFPKSLADQIGILIGGHHGTFPDSSWNRTLSNEKLIGGKQWAEARKYLVLELKKIFPVQSFVFPEDAKLDNSTMMILAGLVSVADWIGSNAAYFPCVADTEKDFPPKIDLQNYAKESRRNAERALHELGWLSWQEPQDKLNFREMFSEIKQPRDLQIQAETISQNLESAGIVVIESPTGEGKTEAAIYLADTFNFNLKQNGIYFALPTQATSDQMFGRVKNFLERRFPNSPSHLQLVHGHAAINADFLTILKDEKGAKNIGQENIYGDDENHDHCGSTVEARAWFTGRKKALLAPFGVGTIDQTLLAVLQTRHVFVRLFGLAHKTIIIDEVHAYDAYMSTLLERLLMWLAALGSPVILLSATLPKERRNKLLEAYLKGLGAESAKEKVDELREYPKDKYPRISYATNERIDVINLDTSDQNTRILYLEHLDGFFSDDANKFEELTRKLKEKLTDGGCAAIICNTVKKAQQIFDTLSKYLTDENNFSASEAVWKSEEIALLHARFLQKDRMKRQKRALLNFGKEGSEETLTETIDGKEELLIHKVNRPPRAILISTQIIEQSLDLDFDLMITELAPLDLILQRAGRLMRHRRENRSANFDPKYPTLWILQPEKDSPDFGVNKIIYDEHILLRSWLFSHELDTIQIPNDVEDLIEKVYDKKQVCPKAEFQEIWTATEKEMRKNLKKKENKARPFRILPPDDEDLLEDFNQRPLLQEDKPEIHKSLQAQTRDDEQPSISVIFLTDDEAKTEDVKSRKDLPMVRFLLARSVSISHCGAVNAILGTSPPPIWKESALLKHNFLVELRADGTQIIGSYKFTIDENLGLVVENLSKEIKNDGV